MGLVKSEASPTKRSSVEAKKGPKLSQNILHFMQSHCDVLWGKSKIISGIVHGPNQADFHFNFDFMKFLFLQKILDIMKLNQKEGNICSSTSPKNSFQVIRADYFLKACFLPISWGQDEIVTPKFGLPTMRSPVSSSIFGSSSDNSSRSIGSIN